MKKARALCGEGKENHDSIKRRRNIGAPVYPESNQLIWRPDGSAPKDLPADPNRRRDVEYIALYMSTGRKKGDMPSKPGSPCVYFATL